MKKEEEILEKIIGHLYKDAIFKVADAVKLSSYLSSQESAREELDKRVDKLENAKFYDVTGSQLNIKINPSPSIDRTKSVISPFKQNSYSLKDGIPFEEVFKYPQDKPDKTEYTGASYGQDFSYHENKAKKELLKRMIKRSKNEGALSVIKDEYDKLLKHWR